jgi:hypothetical protein
MNSELTESSLLTRRMVSASSEATDSWRMRSPQLRAASDSGMVSVTTSSSRSSEPEMRSIAGPDSTACVQ